MDRANSRGWTRIVQSHRGLRARPFPRRVELPETVNKISRMKKSSCHSNTIRVAAIAAFTVASLSSRAASSTNAGYVELDLASDQTNAALHLDPRLLNAWGIVAGPGGVWVNDNHSSLVTAYNPVGKPANFAINAPAPGGGGGAPTGLAANDTPEFVISNGPAGAPATFLMSTEDGTLLAWNHSINGSNAVIVVDNSGSSANYKGLAIARDTNGAAHVYAANFHSGQIDEYDGRFNFVRSFTDPDLPDLYAPFNVRTIRGRLFVTFAAKADPNAQDDLPGPGHGFIDIFDTDGTLLRRFASHGALDSPWGLAVAPRNFGRFSHALLVGNFGDGKINGYDLLTGKWLGNLTQPNGADLVIGGLWGLTFEKDEILDHESDFNAQRLYFTAGPVDEAHGLLGVLRPVSPAFPPAR